MPTATGNTTAGTCPYCGVGHIGTCSRIRSIEYYPDGTVRRVEFHPPAQPIESIANPGYIRVPRPDGQTFMGGSQAKNE